MQPGTARNEIPVGSFQILPEIGILQAAGVVDFGKGLVDRPEDKVQWDWLFLLWFGWIRLWLREILVVFEEGFLGVFDNALSDFEVLGCVRAQAKQIIQG